MKTQRLQFDDEALFYLPLFLHVAPHLSLFLPMIISFWFSYCLLFLSPLASVFTLFSHRWILPLLCGKAFRSVSLVIQQGATTGIVPDPAGATHPNGPMTTPWSSQGRLSTTGTKITSCDCDACRFVYPNECKTLLQCENCKSGRDWLWLQWSKKNFEKSMNIDYMH